MSGANELQIVQYERVVLDYLTGAGESGLYAASKLGRSFIDQGLRPDEVVQLHWVVIDRVVVGAEPGERHALASRLTAVLLEVMAVYGAAHQEIAELLRELRGRYAELKEAKVALEHSQDKLRERTAQLIQNEKMTALGELTAGVAHEINQPLNAIKIISQDIVLDIDKDRLEPEFLRESLAELIAEVHKMGEIIDHMRVFTRKTDGMSRESIDADQPIEGVFKLLGQQLTVRGIEVTREITAGLRVRGNPVELEQVLVNLLTNARDALKDNDHKRAKQICVTLKLADPGAEPCPTVVYEVADCGHGIPAELQDKIFEPFFTRKAPGKGTGLGLSVSSQIVADHGGRIEVESEEGTGTTFRVLIPADQEGRNDGEATTDR